MNNNLQKILTDQIKSKVHKDLQGLYLTGYGYDAISEAMIEAYNAGIEAKMREVLAVIEERISYLSDYKSNASRVKELEHLKSLFK